MRIHRSFRSDAPWLFLLALNESFDFGHGLAELERIAPPAPHEGFLLQPKDSVLHEKVRQAVIADLRQLADEWIKTGQNGGIENPRERNFRNFEPNLRRALQQWAAENPPDLRFDDSGETAILMPARKIDYSAPLLAARQTAMLVFREFLDSPFRYRLFKCRMCKTYYYTERQPSGPIKHGTYCHEHRHIASANRSNERRRAPERAWKIEQSARYWGQWPTSVTDEGEQAGWIAERVNKNVSHKQSPIARNFVTRNKIEIQARAKERKHAKS